MNSYEKTIYGECTSKANSRRLVYINKKPLFIKSPKALSFIQAIKQQVRKEKLLEGHLSLYAEIYYSSRRPDLDPSLILDGLEKLWYENDRQIHSMHLKKYLDKQNPRVYVRVSEMVV